MKTHAHSHTHTHAHIHPHPLTPLIHTHSHSHPPSLTYKQQFNLPSDVKHLFAAEVLLDHPKTKSHLNVTTGEVVFILLLSHPKLPYEKYLAEKEDGSSKKTLINLALLQ